MTASGAKGRLFLEMAANVGSRGLQRSAAGQVKGECDRRSPRHLAAPGDLPGAWADREASKQRAGRAACGIRSRASPLFC